MACIGENCPQACPLFLAVPMVVGRPLHPAPKPRLPTVLSPQPTPYLPYPIFILSLRSTFLCSALSLNLLHHTPDPPHGAPNWAQPFKASSPVCPVPPGSSGQLRDLRWLWEGRGSGSPSAAVTKGPYKGRQRSRLAGAVPGTRHSRALQGRGCGSRRILRVPRPAGCQPQGSPLLPHSRGSRAELSL